MSEYLLINLIWVNPCRVHRVALVYVTKRTPQKLRDKVFSQSGQLSQQIETVFYVCPLIADKLRHNIVEVAVQPRAASTYDNFFDEIYQNVKKGVNFIKLIAEKTPKI